MQLQDFFKENQQNIVPLLEENKLNDIYTKVTQKISIDQQSREDKINKLQDYMKLALLITEQKSYPFEGAANAMLPLVVNSVIQFGATAYPPLVQDDEIVKFKIVGNDDGKVMMADGKPIIDPKTSEPQRHFVGAKAARGRRMATMMNYQLTELMPWWKRDLYQYLMVLAAVGTVYKKVFYDAINKRCVSKFMMPDKIIINDNIIDLTDAVITEILDLSPTKVMENIRNGIFIDYDFDWDATPVQTPQLTQESINPNKDDNGLGKRDFRFVNHYGYLDLDDDGYPEPYIITLDMDKSKVVRIVPDYYLENVQYNEKEQVSKIKRNKNFVDYILIPSPDGGHLGIGFGHLLYNLTNVANSSINQMLDSGHLSIKGTGFIGKSLNIRGGRFSMGLGEWKLIDAFGVNIKDNVVPLPTPEISPVLFSLLGLLIESAKETGSLRDVLTGDTAANMAPTTYMGLVEQGLKQFLAIFKNIYDSQKQEFKLIRECNARNLPDEEYAMVIDEEENDVSAKDDFSAKDCDVIPVADPSSVTSAQKMAQAQVIQAMFQDPYYDPIKVRKMWNNAVQIPGLDDALRMPPPAPDANIIFAEAEAKKAEVKAYEAQIKTAKMQLEAMELDEKSIERKFNIENTKATIEEKKSKTLKNIVEAEQIEKEFHLNVVTSASEAMTKRIEADTNAKIAEANARDQAAKEESPAA